MPGCNEYGFFQPTTCAFLRILDVKLCEYYERADHLRTRSVSVNINEPCRAARKYRASAREGCEFEFAAHFLIRSAAASSGRVLKTCLRKCEQDDGVPHSNGVIYLRPPLAEIPARASRLILYSEQKLRAPLPSGVGTIDPPPRGDLSTPARARSWRKKKRKISRDRQKRRVQWSENAGNKIGI